MCNNKVTRVIAQTLDLIINNPDSKVDSLLSVIDQAYCYMCLATSGAKALPNCTVKTPTFESYLDLMLDLNGFAIQDDGNTNVPMALKLDANYPNPFNPSTTIRFSLPNEAKVKLTIYNVKGQLVKKLVDEKMPAGKHHIVWNGKNEQGKTVSSGIYFTRVEQAGKAKVRKMMMLK